VLLDLKCLITLATNILSAVDLVVCHIVYKSVYVGNMKYLPGITVLEKFTNILFKT